MTISICFGHVGDEGLLNTSSNNSHESTPPEGVQPEQVEKEDLLGPGLPIVRANTPRPLSFTTAKRASTDSSIVPDFPVEAPVAPPLPEEFDEPTPTPVAATPLPEKAEPVAPPEFIWLFEYGLEMDVSYLNSPARLQGLALEYGSAMLDGYTLRSLELQPGHSVITLVPDPLQEVWGTLYRIPRRLTEQDSGGTILLEKVHPPHIYEAIPVTVQEVHRKRHIECITYIASEVTRAGAEQALSLSFPLDVRYARRLLNCARRQKLPEKYIEELEKLAKEQQPAINTGHDAASQRVAEQMIAVAQPTIQTEQNTDPLPVLKDSQIVAKRQPGREIPVPEQQTNRGMLVFALYVLLVLSAIPALAMLSVYGVWQDVLAARFPPPGIPVYVLMYGVLGSCLSCLARLNRQRTLRVPGYVLAAWFARPFTGAVLAGLAFLALNSGLFALSVLPEQHYALYALLGTLAGCCEGWLFMHRK
jgi:cation transport regulator ChaC